MKSVAVLKAGGIAAMVALVVSAGCASTSPPSCGGESLRRIATTGGPEDIVHLPRSANVTRIFVREPCPDEDCRATSARIGTLDIERGKNPVALETAWRPPVSVPFAPLGMSLVTSGPGDQAALYVIDASKPPQLWRLEVNDGKLTAPDKPYIGQRSELQYANDLQATKQGVFVTRFDPFGILHLPWREKAWAGIVRVSPDSQVTPHALGFTGANGITDLPGSDLLVVSDYWERRLRFFSATPPFELRGFATAELEIHPDNLTRDGTHLYIAGQRNSLLAGINLSLPWVPSPSAVYTIEIDKLGDNAAPHLVWDSGWSKGRSVSVAVPTPNGFALGQIKSPELLLVDCR